MSLLNPDNPEVSSRIAYKFIDITLYTRSNVNRFYIKNL